MDVTNLQNKLLQAARKNPPSTAVPYAFEQRIMARLSEAKRVDPLAYWAAALWRAAVSCVVIVLLFGAWSVFTPLGSDSLADDFETTIVAGLNQVDGGW